jgi:hypothetical protein
MSFGSPGSGTGAAGIGTGAAGITLPNLAQMRGSNWGLPNAAADATGVTRPIRVTCLADQLIILPDRGTSDRPRVVSVRQSTREAIDRFVSELWKQMEGWGIAGHGMYWKPVLHVDVAPGGEQNFAELQILLDDSGIVVKRNDP